MKRIFKKFIEMCWPTSEQDPVQDVTNVTIYKAVGPMGTELVMGTCLDNVVDWYSNLSMVGQNAFIYLFGHERISRGDRVKLTLVEYTWGELDFPARVYFVTPLGEGATSVYWKFREMYPDTNVKRVEVAFPNILTVSDIG